MTTPKTKSVRVEIFGNEYVIKGAHDAQFIQSLAHYVDKKMREVAGSTSLVSTNKVAILAALNIAEELFTANEKNDKNKKIFKEKVSALIKKIDDNI